MSGVFKLRGAIKTYEWGKIGLESCVAQFYKSSFWDFDVDEATPYAELWMGTHPSGMSTIPSLDDISLMDWIRRNPDSLGENIKARGFEARGLPFLFKVLSVRKALSIQVHPDKPTAERLHQEFRDKYPDDNHKPEIAVALTPFQALCGFRPISEIKSFIMELPQLREAIGTQLAQSFLDSGSDGDLKELFTALITQRPENFQSHLQDLVYHVQNQPSLSDMCKSTKDMFLKVHEYYPGDIGCFCVFFLNYISLKPGQSVFLAANEPHAYLEGDCIECMACSDNVVRAGLTPKFKDVNTLCNILTYKCMTAEENIFQCVNSTRDPFVKIYDPPIPEFAVARIEVDESEYELEKMNSASLLIVIEGDASSNDGLQLYRGTVLFISSGCNLMLKIKSGKILMYRAYCSESN